MGRYLLRRIPAMLVTLFLASVVIFSLMRLAPGNPAVTIAGPEATPEAIAQIERQLGLDAPWPVQYANWLIGLFTGNLGTSVVGGQPIGDLILSRAESSLSLAISGTLLMAVLGLALGVLGGTARSAKVRAVLDGTFSVLLSLPTYVTSVLLLLLFGALWPVLPVSGEGSLFTDPGEALRYLILPTIALAIPHAAVIGRLLQATMLDQMHEDYVRAAIARGIMRRRLLWIHVLRNSITTAVVVVGIRFGSLIGGAIVVEALFARPGIGSLMVASVLTRDYVVVQDLILLAVFTAVIVQLLSEIVLARADPRVRLS